MTVPTYQPKQIDQLARGANGIGATLAVTSTRALMIRRGASSWHCCDYGTAYALLRRLGAVQ